MAAIITSEQLSVPGAGVELRRNHHLNPGAEGTTLPLEAVTGGTVARATTPAGSMPASGVAYFTLTATGTAVATCRTLLTGRPACSAGQVWAAKVTGRNASAATRTVQLALRFWDTAPGATAGTSLLLLTRTASVAAGADFQLELGGIAPAGALSVGLEISRNATGATGDVLQFDQLQLELLPAGGLLGGYFDGDRTDTAEAIYSWAGAQYDSASILRAPARATTTPQLLIDAETIRPGRTQAAGIIGSPDSYVNLQPAGLRAGTLQLLYSNPTAETDSEAALELLATGGTFLLTYPERESLQMRFVVLGNVSRSMTPGRRHWLIQLDYQELQP